MPDIQEKARLPYPDLTIRGFRGIQDMHISQLGRMTLLTGANNTGKSTVLEAVRLHAERAAPQTIRAILSNHEEVPDGPSQEPDDYSTKRPEPIYAMFHGFPADHNETGTIEIATGTHQPDKLTINTAWVSLLQTQQGMWQYRETKADAEADYNTEPALAIQTPKGRQAHKFQDILDTPLASLRSHRSQEKDPPIPCVTVQSHAGERTDNLSHLWDKVVLTDDEAHVVQALRLIEPKIAAVNMIADNGTSHRRTAVARVGDLAQPVHLRSFGDGMNRLFAITLSLVNAKGGVLLIDEFEHGLHHSIQTGIWRTIAELAQELEVQVLATTHSRDTIESFQKAAAESSGEHILARLTRHYNTVTPRVFSQRELAIATPNIFELR